jgi:hypothetical protein
MSGMVFIRAIVGRFQAPEGAPLRKAQVVWMFDNKIDWVMRLKARPVAVRRKRMSCKFNHMTYKAEQLYLPHSYRGKSSCSNLRSVFRNSLCLQDDHRKANNRSYLLTRLAVMRTLHGVNSMVKLLRAHGGCLGRDRR